MIPKVDNGELMVVTRPEYNSHFFCLDNHGFNNDFKLKVLQFFVSTKSTKKVN